MWPGDHRLRFDFYEGGRTVDTSVVYVVQCPFLDRVQKFFKAFKAQEAFLVILIVREFKTMVSDPVIGHICPSAIGWMKKLLLLILSLGLHVLSGNAVVR